MNIAFTSAPERGATDLLLHDISQALETQRVRVCGIVQTNTKRCDQHPCDMDVKVLPDGPVLRISQSLGTASKGCRLDPSMLEQAVGLVDASLAAGCDVLIVNKFGKHEADGRGFRDVIAKALSLDIPVIVGLNTLNQEAFQTFTGGCAAELAPNMEEILNWILPARMTAAAAE